LNWFSNAPWFPSGYGVQTKLFTPRIFAAGHVVSVTAFAGLHGAPMTVDGIQIWPAARHRYGQDVMNATAKLDHADAIISLLDVWVVEPDKLTLPWYPWTPIDCDPMPRIVYESLKKATKVIAMSKFGKAQCDAVGLDAYYVPHGVETKVFSPADMSEARKHLGWPEDKFIVGMVAANIGNPPRKSFYEQIAAFVGLHTVHPDTMLYLHCDDGSRVGPDSAVDLAKYCSVMGLKVGYMGNDPVAPDIDVLFPDQFFYGIGMIPDAYMVGVYNALDVMTLCSLGEGFGIPLIEAQACGCPVITGDWTAMSELVFGGWKIPKEEADPQWHAFFESFQYRVKTEAVYKRLMMAYDMRGNQDYRTRARDGALAYDADRITEKYWKPVLADIEANLHKQAKSTKANGQTERVVEIPWLLSKLGTPKRILDIGSADAWYLPALVKTGAQVTGIDTRLFDAPKGVTAIVGDASEYLADAPFDLVDLITCISVLDHIGLEAYGNAADENKLTQMVENMRFALVPGGRLLLTVPVGRDCLTTHPGGGQRVFSREALNDLFADGKWQWASASYWVLVNEAYVLADWETVKDVEYATYRAGAVIGLELVRL
jgi:glycosyltransferase involved in cell wall biosynthesis